MILPTLSNQCRRFSVSEEGSMLAGSALHPIKLGSHHHIRAVLEMVVATVPSKLS